MPHIHPIQKRSNSRMPRCSRKLYADRTGKKIRTVATPSMSPIANYCASSRSSVSGEPWKTSTLSRREPRAGGPEVASFGWVQVGCWCCFGRARPSAIALISICARSMRCDEFRSPGVRSPPQTNCPPDVIVAAAVVRGGSSAASQTVASAANVSRSPKSHLGVVHSPGSASQPTTGRLHAESLPPRRAVAVTTSPPLLRAALPPSLTLLGGATLLRPWLTPPALTRATLASRPRCGLPPSA